MRSDPNLARVIHELRERTGLSQKAFGELAKLNKETINRAELGAAIRSDTLSKIAVALNMTTAEIYALTVSTPPVVRGEEVQRAADEDSVLCAAFHKATPLNRSIVRAVLGVVGDEASSKHDRAS